MMKHYAEILAKALTFWCIEKWNWASGNYRRILRCSNGSENIKKQRILVSFLEMHRNIIVKHGRNYEREIEPAYQSGAFNLSLRLAPL